MTWDRTGGGDSATNAGTYEICLLSGANGQKTYREYENMNAQGIFENEAGAPLRWQRCHPRRSWHKTNRTAPAKKRDIKNAIMYQHRPRQNVGDGQIQDDP